MTRFVGKRMYAAVGGMTIALATLGSLPVCAARPNDIDAIYLFGNSLTDTGNYFNFSGSTFPPSPFYYEGRFSNGPVWSEHLAYHLDLNPVNVTSLTPGSPIPAEGLNFSFGGSTTGNTNLGGLPFWGLEQQLNAFNNLLGGQPADEQALYILSTGGNDYVSGTTNPQVPVNNIAAGIERLIDAGVRNIMVANLPNLGDSPLGRSLGPDIALLLNQLTAAHNALLDQQLDQLRRSNPDVDIILLDFNTLFDQILDNPAAFGLANATGNCTGINFPAIEPGDVAGFEACRNALAENPGAFFFWDDQHPTTYGHRVIAKAALKTLQVPEPDTVSTLGLLGLGLLLRLLLSLKQN